MEEYKDLFLAEAQEYLQAMTACLLKLEKDPADSDQLTEIFRAAHSLKGMSGTMGFDMIMGLTHEMESLLDRVRQGRIAVSTGLVNLLFEASDMVQFLVDNLDNQDQYSSEVKEIEARLSEWKGLTGSSAGHSAALGGEHGMDHSNLFEEAHCKEEGPDAVGEPAPAGELEMAAGTKVNLGDIFNEFEKEMLKEAVSKGDRMHQVCVRLREGSLLKSVRSYMVYKVAESQGEVIKTVPSLQELEEEKFDRDFFLLLVGNPDLIKMKKTMEGIAEVERIDIVEPALDAVGEEALAEAVSPWRSFGVAGAADDMDDMDDMDDAGAAGGAGTAEDEGASVVSEAAGTAGGIWAGGEARGRGAGQPAENRESAMAGAAVGAAAAGKKLPCEQKEGPSRKSKTAFSSSRAAEKTVRVETAKLDTLVNLVGELIINRTRVVELGKKVQDENLENSLEQLERITTDLQNAVMTLRMVPIKQVFDRFPRMVRDLGIDKGKEVELFISGEETELDRTIVNQVGDPLVHLLRNAVDHGIEDSEERKKKGKDPVGKIYLEAHHEGSHVVVSVEDDGAGIDPEKIKQKTLEKELVSKEELDKMSEDEVIRLIFSSGFSTSSNVTDVSGRGVGMDVVKTAVEALNGNVEVKSFFGKGSRFILRLPLTLAIIKTLMVRDGKEIYAIPVEAIRENLFIEPGEIKTIQQSKVITLRDEVLSLTFLRESLGMGRLEEREVYPVVVVQTGDRKAGLVVDELLGQQEIVIKSLSNSIMSDIKGIAGATVLGDGRVTLILDVASLLEDGRGNIGKDSINH